MKNAAALRVCSALGTGALFVLLTGQALAQDAAASPATGEDEVILVTGSRIQSGMTTATPVTAVTADELEILSPGVLVESLSQLPQFIGNGTPANPGLTLSSAGPGALNMRGLGASRTLVLFDGRRLPAATRYGNADVNTIPEAFINGVEIVTGGASAAYGTDAVAGVVNLGLNTNFTGIKLGLEGGITERGDGQNWQASVAGGFDVGDRGHVLLSGEYQAREAIETLDGRDYYRGAFLVGGQGGPTFSGPNFVLADNVVSGDASFNGVISTFNPPTGVGMMPVLAPSPPFPSNFFLPIGLFPNGINGREFTPDGLSTTPIVLGSPSFASPIGTVHSLANGGSGGSKAVDERYNLLPESNRANLFAYADYEVSDNLTVFGQASYGRSYSSSLNPGGLLFVAAWPLTIYRDNAYLPQSVGAAMDAAGLTSLALSRVGSLGDVNLTGPSTSYTNSTNNIYAGTLGFDATIGGDGFMGGWDASGYFQRSRTKFNYRQTNVTRTDRYPYAVDAVRDPATNQIVCNITLYSNAYDDCVPLNPFGNGNASPEAIDWITGYDVGQNVSTPIYYPDTGYSLGRVDSYVSTADKVSLGQIDQTTIELSLNGEVFGGIGAGPFMGAFGGSYREDSIDQIVRAAGSNPANDLNFFPLPQNNPAMGIRGFPGAFQTSTTDAQFSDVPNLISSLNVKELFGELLVPLVSDQPFMQQLNVSGAARWADYSRSGGIWSWKLGLDAAVSDSFRLRGTMSRDVRAANFSELFATSGAAATFTDPDATLGNQTKTGFVTSGGNPDLLPETSKTLTFGVVIQPEALPGFALSVDWYDIKLSGEIGAFGVQEIIDLCHADGDPVVCTLLDRDAPTTNFPLGEIIRVRSTNLNLNQSEVSGVDVEGSYNSSFHLFGGDERISTRLFVSWMDEFSRTLSSGLKTDYVGQVGLAGSGPTSLPEWRGTANLTYSNGPFGINLQGRYIGSGLQDANTRAAVLGVSPGTEIANGDNDVPAIFYTDLRLSYDFMDGAFQAYGSVTNLMDTAPPATPSNNIFLYTPYNSGLYDVLGRRFTVGVKVSF